MKVNDYARYVVLILIVFTTTIGAGTVSHSQDEKRIHLGTRGLVDGYHDVHDKDLKAVWNATSFSMYDDGTIKAELILKYLSANPTSSLVYNSTTGRNHPVATIGDLKYLSSIALMKVRGEYYSSQFGTGTHPTLSKVIPIYTIKLDNQTSLASFKAGYNTSAEYFPPIPPNYVLRTYEVQLSWVGVFEDSEGSKYYQWLQGSSPSAYDSSGQRLRPNQEYNSLSGSFDIYMPIPENMTAPLPESVTGTHKVEFDYVKWISENTNTDGSTSSGINHQSSTEFESTERFDFVVVPLYLTIGIPVAIIGAIIGGIIGFRRWRRNAG